LHPPPSLPIIQLQRLAEAINQQGYLPVKSIFMNSVFRVILRALFCLSVAATSFDAAAALSVPPPPTINARAYILMDYDSGQILAESKADERMEPASLTKLMTSYVIYKEMRDGRIKLHDMVTISEHAWRMGGSRTFVPVGKKVSVEDLLKGMIVQSGNDATVALAEYVGGSESVFVSLMNQEAKRLGMTGTHFVDSTGMPNPDHYTTAHDLAVLTRAMIREFPDHYQLYSMRTFTFNGITQNNRNKLLWRDKSVDGVKTGHTESAGFCLVASALQDNMRLISVVLGTDSEEARAEESEKLLSYGFRFYETHRLYAANKPLSTVRIWKGETEKLPVGLQHELYVTIPRGEYSKLDAQMKLKQPIIAPASKGSLYGSLNVSLDGQTVAVKPLVALQDVAEGGLFQQMMDDIKLWFE
jgi:D-alanyl-D-alanine carboxypeptidase (penicillin-binding protein 5/6)